MKNVQKMSLLPALVLLGVLFSSCKLKKKVDEEGLKITETLTSGMTGFKATRNREHQGSFDQLNLYFDSIKKLPEGFSEDTELLSVDDPSDNLIKKFRGGNLNSDKKVTATMTCETSACSAFSVMIEHPDAAPFVIRHISFELEGDQKIVKTGSSEQIISSKRTLLGNRLVKDFDDKMLDQATLEVFVSVDFIPDSKFANIKTFIYIPKVDGMYRSFDDFGSLENVKKDPEIKDFDYKIIVFSNKMSSQDVKVDVARSFLRLLSVSDPNTTFESLRNDPEVWNTFSFNANELKLIKKDQNYSSSFKWKSGYLQGASSPYLKTLNLRGTLRKIDDSVFDTVPRVYGL